MQLIKTKKNSSIRDILLLFPAFLLLLLAKLLIKILPFKQLQILFQKLVGEGTQNLIAEKELAQKALAINRIAARLPMFQFTCLPKAMALKYWLRKYGAIQLHFGIQKDDSNQLIAHAWLSKNNVNIFGEQPDVNYKSIWVWE